MAERVLQTGLSAGMSATSGFHSSEPHNVNPSSEYNATLPQSFVPTSETRVTFRGKHGDVSAPIMAWGAWSWGNVTTWHWSDDEMPSLKKAWDLCVQKRMTFIDTAQAYSNGDSERIHGNLIDGLPRDKVFVQTKWYVVPDNATNLTSPSHAPAKMLKESLSRLNLSYIDCYLVHGPIHASTISQTARGLAECVDSGMTKTVGVANYSTADMLKMQSELAKHGVPLATNQCEYSILRRHPETDGMLQACRDNNIVFQGYSSLAQGRLSGKYTRDNPPPKEYRFSSYPMEKLEPVLDVVRGIAHAHGVSMSAVALNYNMCKGVLPVVGLRKVEQAEQNLGALGWRLGEEEIRRLDEVSFEGKTTRLWQQG